MLLVLLFTEKREMFKYMTIPVYYRTSTIYYDFASFAQTLGGSLGVVPPLVK